MTNFGMDLQLLQYFLQLLQYFIIVWLPWSFQILTDTKPSRFQRTTPQLQKKQKRMNGSFAIQLTIAWHNGLTLGQVYHKYWNLTPGGIPLVANAVPIWISQEIPPMLHFQTPFLRQCDWKLCQEDVRVKANICGRSYLSGSWRLWYLLLKVRPRCEPGKNVWSNQCPHPGLSKSGTWRETV